MTLGDTPQFVFWWAEKKTPKYRRRRRWLLYLFLMSSLPPSLPRQTNCHSSPGLICSSTVIRNWRCWLPGKKGLLLLLSFNFFRRRCALWDQTPELLFDFTPKRRSTEPFGCWRIVFCRIWLCGACAWFRNCTLNCYYLLNICGGGWVGGGWSLLVTSFWNCVVVVFAQ